MTIDEITVGRTHVYPEKDSLEGGNHYKGTWIGPLIMCPPGNLGFFFEVHTSKKLQGGTLLGIYFDEDTKPPCIMTIQEAMTEWTNDDNVLANCGPARQTIDSSKLMQT